MEREDEKRGGAEEEWHDSREEDTGKGKNMENKEKLVIRSKWRRNRRKAHEENEEKLGTASDEPKVETKLVWLNASSELKLVFIVERSPSILLFFIL